MYQNLRRHSEDMCGARSWEGWKEARGCRGARAVGAACLQGQSTPSTRAASACCCLSPASA